VILHNLDSENQLKQSLLMQLHESDCGESFRNRTDPEACIERDWDPLRRVGHPESLRVNAPAALHDCDRQAGKRMLVACCDQGILELFEFHPRTAQPVFIAILSGDRQKL
jgi:hypothetical protein